MTPGDDLRKHLTDALIAAALTNPKRSAAVEILDSIEPGLSLRIGLKNARWSYRSRAMEQSRLRLSLGAWPEVSVGQVRMLVGRLRVGLDADAAGQPLALTMGELLAIYDARRLSQLRKRQVIYRALTNATVTLRHRAPSEIGRRDISEIVDLMAERAPIHANRVLAYMKAFFGWAVGRGYLESNPAAAITKPSREVTRDRTPSLAELVEIWIAAGELGYPFGPVIRLLILTASRRDEIGGMQLAEVSLPSGQEEGSWTLPSCRSKNGRAIRLPLAPLARATLEQAIAQRTMDSSFVFTTTGRTSISGWSRAKARIDERVRMRRRSLGVVEDMPDWRIHDFRRAFATAACDLLGVDPAVADRCLNHTGAATTSTVARIYGRSELFEPRREALSRWAKLITDEVRKAQPNDRPSEDLSDIAA